MPINTDAIFQRGGRELIELLTHCVFSINTDVLFCYCIREFRLRPQAVGAIAIFDVFCDPRAPAPISEKTLLPPKDMRLQQRINQLRHAMQVCENARVATAEVMDSGEPEVESVDSALPAVPIPPRYLFDSLASHLVDSDRAKIATLEQYYDPALTPRENLPGGELSAGQRMFVDNVWTPRIRPYLVSAGFWRVATVG